MSWVVVGIGCCSLMAAAVVIAVFRLRGYWSAAARPSIELAQFSIARYEPIPRLLTPEDLDFLKSLPGYRPEIGEKLRRERMRIFRLYLVDLAADFRALHNAAREMVADADAENAHLFGSLFQQQFTFWRAILGIEIRLMTGGLTFVPTDLRGLIEAMEKMRTALAGMTPAPSAA